MEPEKEVIIVTGGTRGIGRSIVRTLAESGRTVAFTWSASETLAEQVVAETEGDVHAFHLDLADRSRTGDVVRNIEERWGRISGLVNNAGVQKSELLALSSDESWDQIIDVNLGGTFRMSRATIKAMIRQRSGSIVNIASLSAIHGVPGHTAYAASKAGMLALTRCLAHEVGRFGIRINAVVPGFVQTDMTSGLPEDAVNRLRSSECLPSGVAPRDVSATVEFLISDSSAAITGQMIVVDAGTSA